MATAKDIIAKAKEFIGTKEIPANSKQFCFQHDDYGRTVSGAAYSVVLCIHLVIFQLCGAADFFTMAKEALCAALANGFKQEKRLIQSAGGYCVF